MDAFDGAQEHTGFQEDCKEMRVSSSKSTPCSRPATQGWDQDSRVSAPTAPLNHISSYPTLRLSVWHLCPNSCPALWKSALESRAAPSSSGPPLLPAMGSVRDTSCMKQHQVPSHKGWAPTQLGQAVAGPEGRLLWVT